VRQDLVRGHQGVLHHVDKVRQIITNNENGSDPGLPDFSL
jgi:hypothetical protein